MNNVEFKVMLQSQEHQGILLQTNSNNNQFKDPVR